MDPRALRTGQQVSCLLYLSWERRASWITTYFCVPWRGRDIWQCLSGWVCELCLRITLVRAMSCSLFWCSWVWLLFQVIPWSHLLMLGSYRSCRQSWCTIWHTVPRWEENDVVTWGSDRQVPVSRVAVSWVSGRSPGMYFLAWVLRLSAIWAYFVLVCRSPCIWV